MIRKLAHLCLVTDNLDAMVDFYSKKLGLPVRFIFKNAQGQIFGYYLDCGDSTFIEIFDRLLKIKQWGGPADALARGNQYSHLCMEVTGLMDFRESLIKKGLKLTEIVQGMDHSYQSWTADPDGNPMELMEYTHASPQVQRTSPEKPLVIGG
jgi:catechol 2,3-dioxygenase-like lactoylglutathione lyase family enzyme